jgi:hypothetical protein
MLPPTPGLRGLAAFALAFTLPIAFWQLSGSTAMLIFGACMGLVLACSAVWFLFRVQGEEMTPVLGGTAGAFVASILVAYFTLFGIDSLFRAAAQRSGTNQLTSSPMGTIDWDVPIGTGPEIKPKHPKMATSLPETEPETQPATQGGPTSKPGNSNIIVDVSKPPDNGTSVTPKPATMATTTDTTTTPATTTTIASAIPVKPAPSVVKPAVVDVTEPASPLVAKISMIGDLEDGSQVVFSPGPGTVAAAIKVSATEETVQFFAGNPMVKKGEAKFEVENGTPQHYCLSANGETFARVITFPKLAVQLWNTFTNKETRVVPLDSTRGTPELLGFGANESLVILWNKRNQPDIEVVNSKSTAAQTVAFLRLKAFDQSPCNPMISMDGRQLAVAAFLNEKGGIDLWDLSATRKSELRTCWVPLTTWAPPTGIAYGQAGGMLAAFFEVNGKGILYSFRTGDGAMQHEHPYRTLPYPAGAVADYNGRTLEFLDANTWLLLGRALIDVESGKVLGDLQIEAPKAQRVVDKETVLLHTVNAEGKSQLLQVKLKADAIVAKRNEARGIRTAPKGP